MTEKTHDLQTGRATEFVSNSYRLLESYLRKSFILEHPKPYPMNRFKSAVILAILSITGFSFHEFIAPGSEAEQADLLSFPTEIFASVERNGKFSDAEKMPSTFQQSDWEELGFPVLDEKTVLSLKHQLHVIRKDKSGEVKKFGNLEANADQMESVLNILLERAETGKTGDLHQFLNAWQVNGEDREGNVKFTGYFTPVLKVRRKPAGKYQHPVYAFPEDFEGKMPSRRAIETEGALEGMGLELAYAANPFDIYVMQLQGSGTVEYIEDGERTQFIYAGQNGFPYRNIQHFFKNHKDISFGNVSLEGIRRILKKNPELLDEALSYDPSYTFFASKKGLVKGAGNVPLMADYSIAADSRYFPLGSVILAAVPVIKNEVVTHHEYRLLLPQDVGGAIRGQGHVDIYCGNGELGLQKASAMHHYGRMWLLLPKENQQVALK